MHTYMCSCHEVEVKGHHVESVFSFFQVDNWNWAQVIFIYGKTTLLSEQLQFETNF